MVIHGNMKLERREERSPGHRSRLGAVCQGWCAWWPPRRSEPVKGSSAIIREVRFLVSTEAGGEGINLQFCHICVNYDLPWNPMRVEQRVGRIYRFGQTKVVQVYHFFNKGTIEEKVQSYFENRLVYAASAISKVTGEDPEEIKGSLERAIGK